MIYVGTYKIPEDDWQAWQDNLLTLQAVNKIGVDTVSLERVFELLKYRRETHVIATKLAKKELESAGYDERRGDIIDIWITDVPGLIHVNLDKGDTELRQNKPGF